MRELLPYVRRPGRYIGPEPNAVVKQHDTVKLKAVLVYPDLYEIGIANLGLRILYESINALPYALAERAYSPGSDMEAVMARHNAKLTTIESDTPLDTFDIIGITLQTELNYTNAVNILKLAGLPLRAKDRKDAFPLVIGGGSCAYNPEPVADFFDALVIGDGEVVIKEIVDAVIACKDKGGSKQERLEGIARIKGVYVPSLFRQIEDASGNFKGIVPVGTSAPMVSRAILPDINNVTIKNTIVPLIKPIHDRLVVEIARGCTKGCRFCQAGMVYRPVREKDMDVVIREIKHNIHASGFSDVSLLSLSAGDYTHILSLLKSFMAEFEDDRCSVSLPSLRIDSVTGQMLDQIRQVRKTGFTVAIEAGTQRLRDIINKNITEEEILSSVELAAKMGWQTIKLYFMLGLPFETEDDVKGTAGLITRIHTAVRKHNKKTKINASISAFIPKPHTPFQWAEMITPEAFKAKLSLIKTMVKNTGVVLKHQLPEISVIEAVLARGDRRLGAVIEAIVRHGIAADSSETGFDFRIWFDTLQDKGFSLHDLLRQKAYEEPLPWDHINTGIPKSFLFQEYQKAQSGIPTPDCFTGACSDCGVCDFKTIEPIHAKNGLTQKPQGTVHDDTTQWTTTIRVKYTKAGLIRFLGHLELIDFLMHILHRSGLQLAYTKGFHPKPIVSFSDPLPVGIESYAEYIDIKLYGDSDVQNILQALKQREYNGLQFLDVVSLPYGSKPVSNDTKAIHYEMELEGVSSCTLSILSSAADLLIKSDKFMIPSNNKAGESDVRPFIEALRIDNAGRLLMIIRKLNNRIIGPVDVIEKGLGIAYHEIIQAPLKKIKVDFENE
jgi:radical SAM family uncharacterized protein/radical SAM-linked protein